MKTSARTSHTPAPVQVKAIPTKRSRRNHHRKNITQEERVAALKQMEHDGTLNAYVNTRLHELSGT